ncbi:LOW QUALITY PROTEIN: Major facilitator superfamily domain containing protein, partial [Trema orientale]
LWVSLCSRESWFLSFNKNSYLKIWCLLYLSILEGAAYMFARFLTSFLWGILADRYGRKPVIIFGIVSVLVLSDCC